MLAYARNQEPPTTPYCTSDFQEEHAHAHATSSPAGGVIIDCGASNHFSPERSKLLNFREINPEPIRAADRHTFHALSKGYLKINLPNGDCKLTPVTLTNVYYAPKMAFTLISVSIMDCRGYYVHMENRCCTISISKSRVIGKVPLVWGLY